MKVGDYSIPDIRLFPKLYDWIKRLYESYRLEEIINRDVAAQLCGHKSANSGAFISKIADFRAYGLIERRSLTLTKLAERLTYGIEDKKAKATTEAILNVPLWKELNIKFGSKLPENDFWVHLQQITGLDPLEAQKHADTVRKAYLDDISYIIEVLSDEKSYFETPVPTRASVSIGKINIQAGSYVQTTPFTYEGIELAKSFLDLLKTQLKDETHNTEEE